VLARTVGHRGDMAEVFVEYHSTFTSPNGINYRARACGGPADDGLWWGWIEFVPTDGGPALRSSRETTQPNRADAIYWATGLTPVYLEGASERRLTPRGVPAPPDPDEPAYDEPAPRLLIEPPATVDDLNTVRRPGAAYSTRLPRRGPSRPSDE